MQYLAYTGSRNGDVRRFDLRESLPEGFSILGGSGGRAAHTSVTFLKAVHEWEMLVVSINGTVGVRVPCLGRHRERIVTLTLNQS